MDFTIFYDEIIFDATNQIPIRYTVKQGDIESRGLYVTVTAKSMVQQNLTGLTIQLHYKKEDGTKGSKEGVVEGSKFRIDFPDEMLVDNGVIKAELRLNKLNKSISNKVFNIVVNESVGAI